MFNRLIRRPAPHYLPRSQRPSEFKKLYHEIKKILSYFKAETLGEKFDYLSAITLSVGSAALNNATPYLWLHVHQYLTEHNDAQESDAKDDLHNFILGGLGIVCASLFVRSLVDTSRENYMELISEDASDKLRRDVTRQVINPQASGDHAMNIQADLAESANSLSIFGQEILGNMLPWTFELIVAGVILVSQYGQEFGLYILAFMVVYFGLTVKASELMNNIEKKYHDLELIYETVNIETILRKEQLNLYGVSERQLGLQAKLSSEVRMLFKKMQRYGQVSPLLQNLITALYLYANFQSFVAKSPSVNDLVLFASYPITFAAFINSIGGAFNKFRFTQKKLNEVLANLETHLEQNRPKASAVSIVEIPDTVTTNPAAEAVIEIRDNEEIELADATETVFISEWTASEKILEWLKELQPKVESVAKSEPPSLEFRNVTFNWTFEDGRVSHIFNTANVALKPGGLTALVGANGAGKSSFIKMLTNKETPSAGEILVNGKSLADIDVTSTFSVAPQQSVKFQGSFYYNLRFANPHADEGKVDYYINAFDLKNLVNWDESITSDNIDNQNISEGQAQIIGAVRTLLRSDADIFIFDETTSNLDPKRTEDLMKVLTQLAETKIVIICLHDMKLVEAYCKQVMFIHDKKITLDTHEKLISGNQSYQDYFRQEMANVVQFANSSQLLFSRNQQPKAKVKAKVPVTSSKENSNRTNRFSSSVN